MYLRWNFKTHLLEPFLCPAAYVAGVVIIVGTGEHLWLASFLADGLRGFMVAEAGDKAYYFTVATVGALGQRNSYNGIQYPLFTPAINFNIAGPLRTAGILVQMLSDKFSPYLVIASRNSEPSEEEAWQSRSPLDCFPLQWKGSQ